MNLLKGFQKYHRSVFIPAKRMLSRTNLVDITANGVVIGVFKEKIFEHRFYESGESKRYKVGERLAITITRTRGRNRFASIQHFPADKLDEVLVLVNRIAQMEIQRVTTAAAS